MSNSLLTLDSPEIREDVAFRFLNFIYRDNKTMLEIINSANIKIKQLNDELQKAFFNNFVLSADENGIRNYERILNIIPDPLLESLEFRKGRVINRLSMSPPFTEACLRQVLSSILGESNWSYDIDYRKFTFDIYSLIPGRNWSIEISRTLDIIIPANIFYQIHAYLQSWQTVFENHKDWQEVYERYDGWQEVMEGIYK